MLWGNKDCHKVLKVFVYLNLLFRPTCCVGHSSMVWCMCTDELNRKQTETLKGSSAINLQQLFELFKLLAEAYILSLE